MPKSISRQAFHVKITCQAFQVNTHLVSSISSQHAFGVKHFMLKLPVKHFKSTPFNVKHFTSKSIPRQAFHVNTISCQNYLSSISPHFTSSISRQKAFHVNKHFTSSILRQNYLSRFSSSFTLEVSCWGHCASKIVLKGNKINVIELE